MATFFKRKTASQYQIIRCLRECFPEELKRLRNDEIESRVNGSNLIFLKKEKKTVHPLMRLTLPFAGITMLILFIGLPINFIFTGKWGYRWNWLGNWLTALKIV